MAIKSLEPIWFTPPPQRGVYTSGLWKDSPSPPQAPDPVVTANAQGAANIEAARLTTTLGRTDQVTPYGNLTWSQGSGAPTFDQSGYDTALRNYQADLDNWNSRGGGGDAPRTVERSAFTTNPADKWTSTITLDPRAQALLDQDLATRQGLSGATNSALTRTTATLARDPTTGLPAAADAQGALASAAGNFTDPANDLARSQQLAASGGQLAGGQLARLNELYGTDFNYDNVAAMPQANEQARRAVEDALYGRATSRLDPQYQQTHSDLDSRLAAQGITQGSAAYDREQQNLGRTQNDAYQNARDSAVANSTSEMAKLFSMGLAGRQQGVTEANTLRALPSQEATLAAQLNSGFGADNRGYYGTELGQESAIPGIATSEYNMQASERGTALAEQNAQRDRVLNELNALRTGSQVTMPQFGGQVAGAQVGAAPVAQSAYNNYQGALSNYNAQVGSQNSLMSGLAGLGGAAMLAFA